MKVLFVALALGVVLAAGPLHAQIPVPEQFARAQAPAAAAPQTQKPPAPAPAQAAAPPRVPFQPGLKYAFVNVQEIAAVSNEGKAFTGKVQALQQQKVKELQDKQKAIQAEQEKLDKGSTVMSEQARTQLAASIDRQQRDLQRATEDAQQEVTQLTQQLQVEFERRLLPVIDKVAKEKEVHFVFGQESGLVWIDPSLDLTPEVIKAFDASSTAKPAAAAPAGK